MCSIVQVACRVVYIAPTTAQKLIYMKFRRLRAWNRG